MPRMRAAILSALLAVVAARPVAAVESYDDCVALAARDPVAAEQAAAAWALIGGGAAAEHCRAQALIALGATGKAIEVLTDLGQRDGTLPDTVRAEVLRQAGSLLLGKGEFRAAETVARQAIELDDGAESFAFLGLVLGARRDWQGAVAALDRALEIAGPQAAALTLRASAKRRLGRLVEARADVLWAREIAPDEAQPLLELGKIEEQLGNREAARAAYLGAIERDTEQGEITRAARTRLQRMETGG